MNGHAFHDGGRFPAGSGEEARELLGREILLVGGDDPRRHLRLTLDEGEIAYLEWQQSAPPRVKGEATGGVWWIEGGGLRPLRVVVSPAGSAVPALLFAGSPERGLARTRGGAAYQLGARYAVAGGPSLTVIDEFDAPVLSLAAWSRRAVRGFGFGIVIERDVRWPGDLIPLLLLLGMLRLCRYNAPWVTLVSRGAGARAIEGAMEELIRGLAGPS